MISTRFGIAALFLATTIGSGPAQAQGKDPGAALLDQIEAKWGNALVKIRGWSPDGLRQFREGYRGYPAPVLEAALAAPTLEAMLGRLDSQAAVESRDAMAKAFPKAHVMGQTLAGDASDDKLVEARQLAAKVLGDDTRDLVFIPITPCTVWDTRFATNPDSMGVIANATTKRFYSHLDGAGGSFAAYGGNPSCPETAQNFIGFRPFAVMMTVYINDATAQGWLTLYRDGDPDPSFATISVYYSPGPTRTQTVISKSSRGYGTGAYDIAATSRFAGTHASAAVTGYFVKATEPGNLALANSTASEGNILKAGNRFIHNYGAGNTFIGVLAGNFDMTGSGNTGSGIDALRLTTSGSWNTAAGAFALRSNTVGLDNTATGVAALYANTGGDLNTATGRSALTANTVGDGNTATGASALAGNTSGNNNSAHGASALFSNTTGSSNTASGVSALAANTTGFTNAAFGSSALQNNTSGTGNAASGYGALLSNTTGNFNTASGASALHSNTTGGFNTAVGTSALLFGLIGNDNTAIGAQALRFATGTSNIAVGSSAGINLTTGNSNVYIKHAGAASETGSVRIGTPGEQVKVFMSGIRGVTTDVANAINVVIDGNGQLGTASSSWRVKDDIADMDAATAGLMRLRPVTFHYKTHAATGEQRLQYGLIAEEVAQTYPGLVARSADGEIETVMYQFLPPMLLNEYQKQQRTIEAQEKRIAALTQLVNQILARLPEEAK